MRVLVFNNLGSNDTTRVVATESGDAILFHDDDWVITDDEYDPYGSPAVTLVAAGRGAPVRPTLFSQPYGTDSELVTYQVHVPAGERVILMHFDAQSSFRSLAETKAQSLHTLSGDTLNGLTALERREIVNFVVPRVP